MAGVFGDDQDPLDPYVPERAPSYHAGLLADPSLPSREDVVSYVARSLGGISLQQIEQDPTTARQAFEGMWGELTLSERERIQPLAQQFLLALSEAERRGRDINDPNAKRAMEIQRTQGFAGDAAEALGSFVGKLGAVPSMVPNLLEMAGAEGPARGLRQLLYGDNLDTASAERRIRDTFRMMVDPRLKEVLGQGEDMSQLLGRAVAADQEREALGLPSMGLAKEFGDASLDARGNVMAGPQGASGAFETAGDIGAFIVGGKGISSGVRGGLGVASMAPKVGGLAQGLLNTTKAGGILGGALHPLVTGAEFAAVDTLRSKSTEHAGESFLFGTGLGYAGKALGKYSDKLIRGSEEGKRGLFKLLSPEASRQVAIGLKGGNRYAQKPEFRGGVLGSAQRAGARGVGETVKLTGASFAANITKAALSSEYDAGDALMQTLHEIPGHAAFGAFAALGGARDYRLPFETRKGGTDPTTADLQLRRRRVVNEFLADVKAPGRAVGSLWDRLGREMEASFAGEPIPSRSKRRPASALERGKQRSTSPLASVGRALERRVEDYRQAMTVVSTPAKNEEIILREYAKRAESAMLEARRQAGEQEAEMRQAKNERVSEAMVPRAEEFIERAFAIPEGASREQLDAELQRGRKLLQRIQRQGGETGTAEMREGVERLRATLALVDEALLAQIDFEVTKALEKRSANFRRWELEGWLESFGKPVETGKESELELYRRIEDGGHLESFYEFVRDYRLQAESRAMAAGMSSAGKPTPPMPKWLERQKSIEAAAPGKVAEQMAKWRAGRGHVDPRMVPFLNQPGTTPPLPTERAKAQRSAKVPKENLKPVAEAFSEAELKRAEADLRRAAEVAGGEEGEILRELSTQIEAQRKAGALPMEGAARDRMWSEVREEHARALEILSKKAEPEVTPAVEPQPSATIERPDIDGGRVVQPKPIRSNLPKVEREAELASAELPKRTENPRQEPVPGEVVREGMKRGFPIYLKRGLKFGAGRVLSIAKTARQHWGRWLKENFADVPREVRAEALLRARLQAEGYPIDPRTIQAEHEAWIRLETETGLPLDSYREKLDAFRQEAMNLHGSSMAGIVKELAKDPALNWLAFETGELRGPGEKLIELLSVIRHGAEIGMNFRDTYTSSVVRLASTAGPRGQVPKARREWEAEEALRLAMLESSIVSPEVWARIETADRILNEARVGEFRETPIYEWLDKGFSVVYRAPEFPWSQLRNQREAERGREFEGSEVDASGERLSVSELDAQRASAMEGDGVEVTRPKGSDVNPLPAEMEAKMNLMLAYHMEPAGVAPKLEAAGPKQRLDAQRAFAEEMVKQGLAEKVAAEDHYVLTVEGIRLLNDFDRWLLRQGQGERLSSKHPWFKSAYAPWSIRCLSPCGQADGLERAVREGGEKGIAEGDIVGSSLSLLPKIWEWAKGVGRELKASVKTTQTEASLEEIGRGPVELKDEAKGWVSTMVTKLLRGLADMPGGKAIMFTGQKQWTRLLTMEAGFMRELANAVGRNEIERADILSGDALPDASTERWIDALESWGTMSKKEQLKWASGPDAAKIGAARRALNSLRPDLADHLYRRLLDDVSIARARGAAISDISPINLRDALSSIGDLTNYAGEALAWTRENLTPIEREYDFLERAARLKAELEPGESRSINLPSGEGVFTVRGWGLSDYFPHVWAGQSFRVVRDQEFLKALSDSTLTRTEDGEVTTEGRLRIANGYAGSDLVPAYARQKVARNLWKREQNNEGYIKHPAAIALYLHETVKKMAYERTMEGAEEVLLGRYEKLDTSSPKAMFDELLSHHVPDVRQSHSRLAGHSVGANMLIEAKGSLTLKGKRIEGEPRKVRAIVNPGDKFYFVKNESRLESEGEWKPYAKEEGAPASGDVLVLLPAGKANKPENYVRLRAKGLERAQLYIRKGGAVYGMTGPIENTLVWQRADEIARNKGPRELRECHSWYCRAFESVASVMGGISHHAALGGVLNMPIAMTNLVDAMVLHNGAAAGVTTLREQYKNLRPFLSATVPNTKRYWELKGEGISDRDVFHTLATEELARNPENTWARDYVDIVMASPYDLGGSREADLWANSVRSQLAGKAAGEKPAWKRQLDSMSEGAKKIYEKYLEPASFTSFDLSEQYARQALYVQQYRDALKRYGLESGKGGAPFKHSETGEYWRVEPGIGMRRHVEKRQGTLEDPHVMSAHAIAWNTVSRTHFIYRLAYHPEIMRNPIWKIGGHLGTFGTLMMIERSKDLMALGRVIAGKGTVADRPHVARYVKHMVMGLAVYELVDQLLGLDVGHLLGTHPSDIPVLGSTFPQLNDLPNWVRFLPGGFPGGVTTMPAKLASGAAGVLSGAAGEMLSLGRSPHDAFASQLDEWRSHNTSFWLPFDDPFLTLATAPLTIGVGRSLPARMMDIAAMRETGDPEKPLAFGPEIAPRVLSYETALARAFVPGSPSEWTESYRKARSRRASSEALRAVRDQLAVRYFRAEDRNDSASLRQITFEAERLGFGDIADSMRARARTHGWSNAVRAYAGQDPLPVKLQRAIDDTESFSELERSKVHELIWGKQTPMHEINGRKAREFESYPRMRELIDRYRTTFARP